MRGIIIQKFDDHLKSPIDILEKKIIAKDLSGLGRAITLNESTRLEDNQIIDEILQRNSEKLNNSIVISVSGIPGVGKSTFIECLGIYLHSLGKSIAVFTIDPSSEKSHGSILGDKTRMNALSILPEVFIRPSPSSNRLGGLGINTQKNIEIAKVAGFDIILVETVGVGQSETLVSKLSDVFLLLLMPASGDELQGIKKGIMEVGDFFIVNKADGDLKDVAKKSKKEIELALHLTREEDSVMNRIFSFSSLQQGGIDEIWSAIDHFIAEKKSTKAFYENRIAQRQFWLESEYDALVFHQLKNQFQSKLNLLKQKIANNEYVSISDMLNTIHRS